MQHRLRQAERAVGLVGERDELGVERRVVGAERLGADLRELPLAAGLRLLVAEHRPGVPELHRQRAALEPGLEGRADGADGALRAQRDRAVAAVGEGEHLLADDVGRLADAAGEQRGVLEDRQLEVAVAGQAQRRGHRLADGEQVLGARRDVVGDALGRACEGRPSQPPGRRRAAAGPAGTGWSRARGRSSSTAPCPGSTTVSSAIGRITDASEACICSQLPPGRSVRPIEPANSTSPDSSSGGVASPSSSCPGSRKTTEPAVWPGAKSMPMRRPASSSGVAGSSRRTSSGARPLEPAAEQLRPCRPTGTSPGRRAGRGRRGGSRPGCPCAPQTGRHGERVVEVAVGQQDRDRAAAAARAAARRAGPRRRCRGRRRRTAPPAPGATT